MAIIRMVAEKRLIMALRLSKKVRRGSCSDSHVADDFSLRVFQLLASFSAVHSRGGRREDAVKRNDSSN